MRLERNNIQDHSEYNIRSSTYMLEILVIALVLDDEWLVMVADHHLRLRYSVDCNLLSGEWLVQETVYHPLLLPYSIGCILQTLILIFV